MSRRSSVCLTAWLLACASSVPHVSNAAPPSLAVRDPAPAFTLRPINAALSRTEVFALKTEVERAKARGGKGLVLSFAASYCAPCLRELEELAGREDQLERSGWRFVLVVIDREPEGQKSMEDLVRDRLALRFPVVFDRMGLLARRFGVVDLPLSVGVDPEGRVAWVRRGYDSALVPALLEGLVPPEPSRTSSTTAAR